MGVGDMEAAKKYTSENPRIGGFRKHVRWLFTSLPICVGTSA